MEHKQEQPDVIQVGCWVRIRDPDLDEVEMFHLVEPVVERPSAGRISPRSPFAQALIGAQPGEIVTFETPTGKETLEIIEAGWD
jgi:transcription elongation GreA/GreB family factor